MDKIHAFRESPEPSPGFPGFSWKNIPVFPRKPGISMLSWLFQAFQRQKKQGKAKKASVSRLFRGFRAFLGFFWQGNRAELKLKAEEEARKTFVFKKRSGSRSVRVNNNVEPAVKRAKLSADDRKEKISAVSIQIDLVSKQITAKRNLCSRATSVKYYTLCSKLQGEMRALFKEKGSLESQLKELQKKESKSKWYKKKNSKPESLLPPPLKFHCTGYKNDVQS